MRTGHFVEDYQRHIRTLLDAHPEDRAMSLAVGGNYVSVGQLLADLMAQCGLRDGMRLIDIGCGSGRLAVPLSRRLTIDYLGTDVVPELLAYARRQVPGHFRFEQVDGLSIPAEDASADMVCAFSVFTHLLHEESYVYLQECHRVLEPGGRLVFSFLEFDEPDHWIVFGQSVDQSRANRRSVLNTFIERRAIEVWAERLGFENRPHAQGERALRRTVAADHARERHAPGRDCRALAIRLRAAETDWLTGHALSSGR